MDDKAVKKKVYRKRYKEKNKNVEICGNGGDIDTPGPYCGGQQLSERDSCEVLVLQLLEEWQKTACFQDPKASS